MLECLAFKTTKHRDSLRVMKEVRRRLGKRGSAWRSRLAGSEGGGGRQSAGSTVGINSLGVAWRRLACTWKRVGHASRQEEERQEEERQREEEQQQEEE
jgi:hypothetical protein